MGHSNYAACFHVHIIYIVPSDLNYVPETPKYALLTGDFAINANQQKRVNLKVLIVMYIKCTRVKSTILKYFEFGSK